MMNQSASATRRPTGSTATAGCCPMLVHPQFYVNTFAAQAPLPPPNAVQQCLLGSQTLPPPPPPPQQQPTSHHPATAVTATQLQQQSLAAVAAAAAAANVAASATLSAANVTQQHNSTTGNLTTPTSVTNNANNNRITSGQQQASRHDQSNTLNTSISTHTLPIQHLFSNRHPASECMAFAAALASASFHQHQQLQQAHQQQQLQQQQQQQQSQQQPPQPRPLQQQPQPQPLQQQQQQQQQPSQQQHPHHLNVGQTPINHTQQSTNSATTTTTTAAPSNPNQVPLLNFNSYPTTQPFLNAPGPAPMAAHTAIPPPPPLPFYSLPQMEQALALLANPTVANNLFNTVLSVYLQGGLRTEPHLPHHHHHHHTPHHYHQHLHGSHHHHHHHHGPNGQSNGQDDTMLTISESKPRGLNRAEIDSLTPYIQMNEKDSRSCVICLSKFELKSKIRPLPCNHAFHAKCVDKWLRANRTCPICRRDALKTYGAKIKRI